MRTLAIRLAKEANYDEAEKTFGNLLAIQRRELRELSLGEKATLSNTAMLVFTIWMQGRWKDAEAEYQDLLGRLETLDLGKPARGVAHRVRALGWLTYELKIRRDWAGADRAVVLGWQLIKANDSSPYGIFDWAPLLLPIDRKQEYRRLCEQLLETHRGTEDAVCSRSCGTYVCFGSRLLDRGDKGGIGYPGSPRRRTWAMAAALRARHGVLPSRRIRQCT